MDLAHDEAHKATDKTIAQLERRIQKVYKEAQMDLTAKARQFFDKFEVKAQALRKQVETGEITEAQYQAWLRGQVFQGKQWQDKLTQITDTVVNADKVAQKITNGEVFGVFANNATWQSYLLEKGAGLDFGFGLYDSSTVARLLREQPNLLPPKRVDIPKDRRWSKAKISQQITQGIIQGESLDQIAARLQRVTGMAQNFARTNARTAMTGAQNAGRQESLNRAAGMGIKTRKEWLATLDGHTRVQHAKLDGVAVEIDEDFEVDGYRIGYPGDPHAAPEMVYNCRCTMIGDLVDYPDTDEDGVQRRDNITGQPIKDMTFKDWQAAKEARRKRVE